MRLIHSVVKREKPPSKRPRIRSRTLNCIDCYNRSAQYHCLKPIIIEGDTKWRPTKFMFCLHFKSNQPIISKLYKNV